MSPEERKVDQLFYSVEKSMRYHQRRRGFYDWAHRWMMFLIILFGGGAVASMSETLGGPVAAIFGAAASAAAALNLVWNTSHKARDHEILYRRFSDLAIDIRSNMASVERHPEWDAARKRIEADEYPVYYALEADCDNQIRRAWGRDKELVRIGLWERLTMDWLRHKPRQFADRAPGPGA